MPEPGARRQPCRSTTSRLSLDLSRDPHGSRAKLEPELAFFPSGDFRPLPPCFGCPAHRWGPLFSSESFPPLILTSCACPSPAPRLCTGPRLYFLASPNYPRIGSYSPMLHLLLRFPARPGATAVPQSGFSGEERMKGAESCAAVDPALLMASVGWLLTSRNVAHRIWGLLRASKQLGRILTAR
jgi:hypothetical protein